MSGIRPTTGDSSWFVRDRFGLFIHWGLYALPARHEWVRHRERIPEEIYNRYFDRFDPDLYDPNLWAEAASGAGMKYFVVTTKHHEGFCLWDSDLTDFKAPNTPARRDLIVPMVEAFRRRQMRVGFYHSLIDWHHPHFVIDRMHPMFRHPERDRMNRQRDLRLYTQYLHGQVRELLTRYGRIDLIWLDYSYAPDTAPDGTPQEGKGRAQWDSERLVAMVRELQPEILINDRLDLHDVPGGWDFKTPEQFMPRQWVQVDGRPVVWEACHTFSGSWGYYRDETTWKTVDQLIRILIDTVGKGGNLLLNVGPTGRGEFDSRALDRLAGMGQWMRRHGRAIYGCTQAPGSFRAPEDCRLTYNPQTSRLYVHLFAWPFEQLHLDGMAGRVEYAQFLHDASEVQRIHLPPHQAAVEGEMGDTLTLQLPVIKPDVAIPVIELFLKR